MRHNYKGRKLGASPAHTKAMKRSLTAALLYNDRIKTIESRAKEIRPEVDRIITWAKKGDLHSRRLAIARLGGDKELVREVFEKVEQGMFADRQGGYTRIMKLGPRKGDGAPMVIMELCTEPVAKKGKKTAEAAKPKKAAAKKAEKVEEPAEEVIEEATDEAVVEDANAEAAEAQVETTEEAVEEVAEAKDEKAEEAEESKEAEEVVEEQAKAEEAEAADAEVAEEAKGVESEKDHEE